MAVVTFDPAAFREIYPRFTAALISDAQLRQAFDVACLLVDNTDSSPIPYDPAQGIVIRQTLLDLLVCHLGTLALWPAGQSGPVASSAEGSVSVSFALPQKVSGQWFAQTPCGSTFWLAIRPYVTGPLYFPVSVAHPW